MSLKTFGKQKKQTLPIGVDLGFGEIKLAQLRVWGDQIELLAFASAELPRSCRDDLPQRMAVLAESIRGALASSPFNDRRCVLSLPAAHTFVHHVKVPRLPAEQRPAALRLELQDKLRGDPDEMVIRYIDVTETSAEGRDHQELIVVAAAREIVDAYLQMARSAKLDVVAVNIEPCAIVECFAHLLRRSEDSARTMLFVDIGTTSTQVVISHGRGVVFARNLGIGGEQFDQAIASGLSMSADDAHALRWSLLDTDADPAKQEKLDQLLGPKLDEMGAEIIKCLRYYESIFKNRSAELVILLGGQAYDTRLCQALASRLDLAATVGDPLARIRCSEAALPGAGLGPRRPRPNWAVAIGLSLGAAAPIRGSAREQREPLAV